MTAVKRLEWDSEMLRVRVGRWEGPRLAPPDRGRMEREARAMELDCVFLFLETDRREHWLLARQDGYLLTDVRIDLVTDCVPVGENPERRPATPADVEALQRIAVSSYGLSRFYFDPNLDRQRVDGLHEAWIENSVLGEYGDATLVRGPLGSPEGFVTCHVEGDAGRIGLVGVGAEARGRGIGGKLIGDALGWFYARGLSEVRVATQARNIGALRLYERAGFQVYESHLIFHYWAKAGDRERDDD